MPDIERGRAENTWPKVRNRLLIIFYKRKKFVSQVVFESNQKSKQSN